MKRRAPNWKPSEEATRNARRVLPKLVRDYFSGGRKLDDDSSAGEMHAFRLKTKHLRYTLEAFTKLYDSALKARIDRLKPIQNALGERNDCEVLLAEFGEKLSKAARTHIKKCASEKQAEFLRYWREEFDAAGEDKKWEQYLSQ